MGRLHNFNAKNKMTTEENKTEIQENENVPQETGTESSEAAEQENIKPITEAIENIEKQLNAKVEELNDKYIRLYSEFDNYRKRTQKEKIELHKTAGEDIFKILLPVLDDFERAMNAMNEAKDIAAVKEGVELIFNKLKNGLQQKGLAAMESKGQAFDADIHEAITNIPAPSEDLKGKVVEELEKGYSLNGKVIRFAKVIVGN
jgi:molecular chaperone GrpE